jgi:hypothetical protein
MVDDELDFALQVTPGPRIVRGAASVTGRPLHDEAIHQPRADREIGQVRLADFPPFASELRREATRLDGEHEHLGSIRLQLDPEELGVLAHARGATRLVAMLAGTDFASSRQK